MNVLLINGSPRGENSNTLRLSRAFLRGLKEKQTVTEEQLDVNALNIKPCLGCFGCWKKTPGKCIIKDDMEGVIEKILWADLVVWSFPLYYFNVPAQLKTIIDRQLPMILPFMEKDAENGSHPTRYDVSRKKHLLVSTCGFYTVEGNYDSVYPMFDHFLGKGRYETIFCGQGELFGRAELKSRTDEYLSFVTAAGREYAKGSITAATRDKLNTLLFPRETFEIMADASWGVDRETGETVDETLAFTRQMAGLYRKESYKKDLVLQMDYTDVNKTYQLLLTKDKADVHTENFLPYTTKVSTPFTLWQAIAKGEVSGAKAMMKRQYTVDGKVGLIMNWKKYFR